MSKQDLVTIITPSYNSKKFVSETIDSVLKQTYKNFEMIIVDDCSSDNSAEYIQSILPDSRFKIVKLSKNVGAAEARNVALRLATGKFIAFLDSDDKWHPDKLRIQIDFMMKYNIAFSYTSYELINEQGLSQNKVISSKPLTNFNGYMKNTIIGCLTVVIDRQKLKYFEMPNLKSSHDMALWGDIMLSNNISAYGLDKSLSSYRLVTNSNTANKLKAAKDVWFVYRRHFNMSLLTSCWYFVNYAFNATIKRI